MGSGASKRRYAPEDEAPHEEEQAYVASGSTPLQQFASYLGDVRTAHIRSRDDLFLKAERAVITRKRFCSTAAASPGLAEQHGLTVQLLELVVEVAQLVQEQDLCEVEELLQQPDAPRALGDAYGVLAELVDKEKLGIYLQRLQQACRPGVAPKELAKMAEPLRTWNRPHNVRLDLLDEIIQRGSLYAEFPEVERRSRPAEARKGRAPAEEEMRGSMRGRKKWRGSGTGVGLDSDEDRADEPGYFAPDMVTDAELRAAVLRPLAMEREELSQEELRAKEHKPRPTPAHVTSFVEETRIRTGPGKGKDPGSPAGVGARKGAQRSASPARGRQPKQHKGPAGPQRKPSKEPMRDLEKVRAMLEAQRAETPPGQRRPARMEPDTPPMPRAQLNDPVQFSPQGEPVLVWPPVSQGLHHKVASTPPGMRARPNPFEEDHFVTQDARSPLRKAVPGDPGPTRRKADPSGRADPRARHGRDEGRGRGLPKERSYPLESPPLKGQPARARAWDPDDELARSKPGPRSGAEFSGATPGRGRQRVDDSPAGRVVDRSPLEPPRVAGMGYKGAGGYNGKTFKLPGATSPAISPAQYLHERERVARADERSPPAVHIPPLGQRKERGAGPSAAERAYPMESPPLRGAPARREEPRREEAQPHDPSGRGGLIDQLWSNSPAPMVGESPARPKVSSHMEAMYAGKVAKRQEREQKAAARAAAYEEAVRAAEEAQPLSAAASTHHGWPMGASAPPREVRAEKAPPVKNHPRGSAPGEPGHVAKRRESPAGREVERRPSLDTLGSEDDIGRQTFPSRLHRNLAEGPGARSQDRALQAQKRELQSKLKSLLEFDD